MHINKCKSFLFFLSNPIMRFFFGKTQTDSAVSESNCLAITRISIHTCQVDRMTLSRQVGIDFTSVGNRTEEQCVPDTPGQVH